jgi:hypothetical protein
MIRSVTDARPRDRRDRAHGTWPGRRIITASWVGTAVFTVTALAATIKPDDVFESPAIVVALVLFAIGTVLFLAAYAKAVSRSRFDNISVVGVYFLAGCAPRPVQVRLLGSLAVEVAVAVATASIRPFTSLAYGILVPMFGLACCGLWGAYHGTYPRRADPRDSLPPDD